MPDQQTSPTHSSRTDDKLRYLLISSGRSGSSLLAAILADAGGNFDMPRIAHWNPGAGAYEHPTLLSALRWRSRAAKIDDSLIPNRFGQRQLARRMAGELSELLARAQFLKATPLLHLTPQIKHMGYSPRVIVPYRDFFGYARSLHVRRGPTLPELAAMYVEAFSTALLQLQIYGGCVVAFEELVDPSVTGWAEPLAELTGIDRARLLACRDERVRPRPSAAPDHLLDYAIVDPRVEPVCAALDALRGRVVPPEGGA